MFTQRDAAVMLPVLAVLAALGAGLFLKDAVATRRPGPALVAAGLLLATGFFVYAAVRINHG